MSTTKKYGVHIDLQKNELRNAVIQKLASAPGTPTIGQIYFDTALDKFGVYTASGWVYMGSGAVSSVFGRTGAVVSTNGDYTASQVTNVPAGNIAAVTVQAALNELDSEKSAVGHTHTASEITDFNTAVRTNRLDQMSAPTASVSLNSQKITGLGTGTISTDAVNKGQMDTAIADALTASDAFIFKGGIDASSNPNYPAANAGWAHKITVAGKIGGASGANVQVGDTIICTVDSSAAGNQATVGANWLILQVNLEYASVAETETKSDNTKAVTPAGLVNFTIKKIFTIGDGSATSFTVTHSLNTKDVIVQVRDASTDEVIECGIVNGTVNATTLDFTTAPATNAYKVTIIG